MHREWGKGTELEMMECGLHIGTYCSPISRYLAHFPPFFRQAGPCHARPPRVHRDNRRSLSATAAFPAPSKARRSDALIDVAVHFIYLGACRRCSRFLSGCSWLFFIAALAWVDSRHVSRNGGPLPACTMTSGRREGLLLSAAFYFITFGIEMK